MEKIKKIEKIFVRRLHYTSKYRITTQIEFNSFDDIWYTRGMYGFSPYVKKINVPYSIDFLIDFFGDSLINNPSYLNYKDGEVSSISNGNKILKLFIPKDRIYNPDFINKIMKENFPFSSS